MSRPGSGFESNGKGRCTGCGHPRMDFGFMSGKCECTQRKFYMGPTVADTQRKKSEAKKKGVVT